MTGAGSSVANFSPQPHHCAGPRHFVNGGILATLIDCHCVCTAMALAYAAENRAIGTSPERYFATKSLTVTYSRPTPVAAELELTATLASGSPEGYVLACDVHAAGKVTVSATVEAVPVPAEWMQRRRD